MKLQKVIEYFYNAGPELILKILVPVWVLVCILVGIPAALILGTLSFCQVKSAAAAARLAGLRARISELSKARFSKAILDPEENTSAEPEAGPAAVTA